MVTPSALLRKLLFFIIFLSSSFTNDANAHAVNAKPRRINLIHRDSLNSPYYNPNATISDRAKRAIESSIARFAYINAKTTMSSPFSFHTNDNRAPLVGADGGGLFLANISIGEPPTVQLVSMDTGSGLLWIQCLPCTKCFKQSIPIFDPSKSSTYVDVSCDSPNCKIFFDIPKKCDKSQHCIYSIGYVDGTGSKGSIATEKLTFETSDEGIATVDNVIIGCGYENNNKNTQESGVLGIGPGSASLVSRLGSKFSYCIGDITKLDYKHNQLILGDGAIIEGDPTPLELFNEFYYLTLESIGIGEKRLNIDSHLFKRTSSGTGGVVIDSGATLTFLASNVYTTFSKEVKVLLENVVEKVKNLGDPTDLCYKGDIGRDLKGFPVVTFYFAGGAELGLDVWSMFMQERSDIFCMAVKEVNHGPRDLNVIGILAQQSYNVAYDLAAKTIYFQRIDCELLEG